MHNADKPGKNGSQSSTSPSKRSRNSASCCLEQSDLPTFGSAQTASFRAEGSPRTASVRKSESPHEFSSTADRYDQTPVCCAMSAGESLRQLGRPPVPTWKYLYERGKHKVHQRNCANPKTESFTPKLDRHSLKLAAAKNRKPLWISKASEAKLQSTSPKSVKIDCPLPEQVQIFVRRMENHRELTHQKRAVQLMMVSDKEIQDCSFHPQLSSRHKELSRHAVPPRRCGSLYERGIRSIKAKVDAAIEWQKQKEDEEIASCRLGSRVTNRVSKCKPRPSSHQLGDYPFECNPRFSSQQHNDNTSRSNLRFSSKQVHNNAFSDIRESVFQVEPTALDVDTLEQKVLGMLVEWREKNQR